MKYPSREVRSHGSGEYSLTDFRKLGKGVILEPGILVFHPENIEIEDNAYIGHYTILKGYYLNTMIIGEGTWVGQQCFFHSAGGLEIGRNVGIGPGVRIITSQHEETTNGPILHAPVKLAKVTIGDDCDIGTGAIILPGVTIGQGVLVGAGTVVTKDLPAYSVAAGVPARIMRQRGKK